MWHSVVFNTLKLARHGTADCKTDLIIFKPLLSLLLSLSVTTIRTRNRAFFTLHTNKIKIPRSASSLPKLFLSGPKGSLHVNDPPSVCHTSGSMSAGPTNCTACMQSWNRDLGLGSKYDINSSATELLTLPTGPDHAAHGILSLHLFMHR